MYLPFQKEFLLLKQKWMIAKTRPKVLSDLNSMISNIKIVYGRPKEWLLLDLEIDIINPVESKNLPDQKNKIEIIQMLYDDYYEGYDLVWNQVNDVVNQAKVVMKSNIFSNYTGDEEKEFQKELYKLISEGEEYLILLSKKIGSFSTYLESEKKKLI